MAQSPDHGLFALSVDVRGRLSDQQVTRLLQLLRHVRTPATLALPSPGEQRAVARIQAEPLKHEFAILADDDWTGPQVGRTKFARELARRVELATTKGLSVRSLALGNTKLTSNLDLLVKHRISSVRSRATTGFQPQSLRFGIWQAPVSFTVPSTAGWSLGGLEWTVSRALSRAAKSHDLVHLVTDIEALSERNHYATLERILGLVQKRQVKGLITTVTLGGLVDSLTPRRQTPASHSVLRVA